MIDTSNLHGTWTARFQLNGAPIAEITFELQP